MGMYTELHFNAELRRDTPPEVIEILRYMVGDTKERPFYLPPDPLFYNATRWEYMLQCDSYYFAADTHSTLRYDDISRNYYLCIRCNFKNYDNEVGLFLDWIMRYVEASPGDFLGFHRYEETEVPSLIFMTEVVHAD